MKIEASSLKFSPNFPVPDFIIKQAEQITKSPIFPPKGTLLHSKSLKFLHSLVNDLRMEKVWEQLSRYSQEQRGLIVLELVKTLDGKDFQLESRDGEWEFYMLDRIDYLNKQYRLVWCFRDQCLFIGVINCFRR